MMEKNKIKRLCCFDFDGTLMQTPLPEEGKPKWEKHYGIKYSYEGWWGRKESLDLNVFDIKPFPLIYKQLIKEQSKPNTCVIILTSRMEKLRPEVQAILNKNTIHVDSLEMRRNIQDKGQRVLNYIEGMYGLEEICVYDDRECDIESYRELENKLPKNIKLNIYEVNDGNMFLINEQSKTINIIIKEEVKKILENVINIENLPMFLYHVTVYPDKILDDGYLKAQSFGSGFGGGLNKGVSVFSDKILAETYYWGILFAVLLSKVKNRNDVVSVLDYWIKKQEKRIGINLNDIKNSYLTWFDYRANTLKNENILVTANEARKTMHLKAVHVSELLEDPVIIGELDRFKPIKLDDVSILRIKSNDIEENVEVIKGTDHGEIRILGDVLVFDRIV